MLRKKKKKKVRSTSSQINPIRAQILAALGLRAFIKHAGFFLDYGDEDFNAAFGSPKGVPSGRLVELSGVEHVGKTLWTVRSEALAQEQHNAFVIHVDLEGSDDPVWSVKLGVKRGPDDFYLIQPLMLTLKKQRKRGKKIKAAGEVFLQSIEWVFKEVEAVIKWVKEKWPHRPIFVGLDSVANMQTEAVIDAGTTDANMRTNMDRAMFLSNTLPRWVQLAANYDIWFYFINQIRTNPAKAFGNPEYTPGGKGLAHNAQSRVWLRRLKGGRLLVNGKQVGLKGKAINIKNKMGYGSSEGRTRGYQIKWHRPMEKAFKFMDIKTAEKD